MYSLTHSYYHLCHSLSLSLFHFPHACHSQIHCCHGVMSLDGGLTFDLDPSGCQETVALGRREEHESRCLYAKVSPHGRAHSSSRLAVGARWMRWSIASCAVGSIVLTWLSSASLSAVVYADQVLYIAPTVLVTDAMVKSLLRGSL